MVEHRLDEARTVVHDLDRAGDYYDAWCSCGQQVAARVPHLKEKYGPGGSVEEGLRRHVTQLRTNAVHGAGPALVALVEALEDEGGPRGWSFPHGDAGGLDSMETHCAACGMGSFHSSECAWERARAAAEALR